MKLLALIPARGGSKRIPRKNIRPFCGKPLLQWTIEAAQSAACIDQIVVSTDDLEIAEVARAGGAEVPFMRPTELATDDSPSISTVLHTLHQLPAMSDIILLQPTSPLRSGADIDGIFSHRNYLGCANMVSVVQTSKHPAWAYNLSSDWLIQPIVSSGFNRNRQDLPPAYMLNGALYLASREFLLKEKTFLTPNTAAYVMPPERSPDIDTPIDWQWAEFLMASQKLT